jgi:hypothetical protein
VTGRLQEQLRLQQGEIEELRQSNTQLIRHLHAQEVRHNEEITVVLRAVNRNTNHIQSLRRHLIPQDIQAQPKPVGSDESQASNVVNQPSQHHEVQAAMDATQEADHQPE